MCACLCRHIDQWPDETSVETACRNTSNELKFFQAPACQRNLFDSNQPISVFLKCTHTHTHRSVCRLCNLHMQLQVSTHFFDLVSLVLVKVSSDIKNGRLMPQLVALFHIYHTPIKTKTGVCYEQQAQQGRLAGSSTPIIWKQVTSFY